MVTKLLRAGTRMSIAEFLDLPDTEEREKWNWTMENFTSCADLDLCTNF